MLTFVKNNWKILLIGVIGVILGVLGNMYANKLSEERIIKALTAQIEAIKTKQLMGKATPEEQKRVDTLQTQLNIIKEGV